MQKLACQVVVCKTCILKTRVQVPVSPKFLIFPFRLCSEEKLSKPQSEAFKTMVSFAIVLVGASCNKGIMEWEGEREPAFTAADNIKDTCENDTRTRGEAA